MTRTVGRTTSPDPTGADILLLLNITGHPPFPHLVLARKQLLTNEKSVSSALSGVRLETPTKRRKEKVGAAMEYWFGLRDW